MENQNVVELSIPYEAVRETSQTRLGLEKIHIGYCKILHEERVRAKISREALANQIGVSLSLMDDIESGLRSLKAREYYSAIQFLGSVAMIRATKYHLETSCMHFHLNSKTELDCTNENFDGPAGVPHLWQED